MHGVRKKQKEQLERAMKAPVDPDKLRSGKGGL